MYNSIDGKEAVEPKMIGNFYPINQWTVVEPKRWLIDETTRQRYPYCSENDVRVAAGCSTLVTPLFHVVGLVASVGLRIIKLFSFWHFWKSQTEPLPFTARLQEAGMDLLKIVTHPFAILALESVSFYGIFRPYDAMKLYCSIEVFQYDRHLLTSLLSLNPEEKAPPQSTPDTEPPQEPLTPQPQPLPDTEPPQEPLTPQPQPLPDTEPPQEPKNPHLNAKTPPVVDAAPPPEPIAPVIPDIAKIIQDKIDELNKRPIPNLQQMKGATSDLIIDHIINYPQLNLNEVIKTSLEIIKDWLVVHKLLKEDQAAQRLNGLKWNEEYIKEALIKKLFIEATEKDNLKPLMILEVPDNQDLLTKFKMLLSFEELQATAVKLASNESAKLKMLQSDLKKRAIILNQLPDCAEEFKPSFTLLANTIQEKYMLNFKDIHDLFRKASNDSTSSSELDEAESEEDPLPQTQDNNNIIKLLDFANKLNAFLLLFMEEPVARYYGMDILQQTLTKLFDIKLDVELFAKIAQTKNLNSLKGIASAIVATGEYLKNIESKGDPSLEHFNTCCQIILQSLNYNEHQKSIKNSQNLLLSRYILFLTLVFQDAFLHANKTLESTGFVNDISTSSVAQNVIDIQKHMDKINILLETDFKVEVSKPQDDGLVALISSIPNILPNDPRDIQQWLNGKTEEEKEIFSAWLKQEESMGFANFTGYLSVNLEVIHQVCLAGV